MEPPSNQWDLEGKLNGLLDRHQRGERWQSYFSGDPPKIQKVPSYLRQRSDFDKYYFPKVVSIGPIHHFKCDGAQGTQTSAHSSSKELKGTRLNVKQGEEYKKIWASTYLDDHDLDKQDAQRLVEKIQDEMDKLKEYYTQDAIQCFDNNELAWIFFVDGCAVLHIMDKVKESKLEAQDTILLHDLLLLENQLPYRVLMILTKRDNSTMIGFIQSFLDLRGIIKSEKTTLREPHHLLDLLRIMIVVEDCNKEGDHTLIGGMPSNDQSSKGKKNIKKKLQTHRNIQELLTAGFKIKENVNQSLTNIHVDGLKLYLSRLTMDDFTAQTFLNMIAYEMCPDFKNHYEISNYVWFLNSLIDHADDVKELRKARVLNNLLGSDEEVAKIFNTVSTDLVIYTGKYKNVTDEIEQLYKKKVSIWLTELRLKHFNTPWKIIGLISAVLGVFLTIVTLMRELRGKIKMD